MNEFQQQAITAARNAREIILEHYKSSLDIDLKSDQTPVTIADREAENVIRETLLSAFPDHGMYGEEHGWHNGDAEYLWLVDPIDGTKSFINGYGFFSTQIALLHKGQLILGVSCAPAMNEIAWALHDAGAFLNSEALQVSAIGDLSQAAISTGNIQTLAGSDNWSTLGEILASCNRTRGYGDFYHYHRLAAGQIDAVIESDVNILDIAALTVIVREAGGVITDLDGRPIGLETCSVLAANPVLHTKLLSCLKG